MAFVIVAHRGADAADLLPELLSRAAEMPVIDVKHNVVLEPNRVYVVPHDQDMTTNGSDLELQPRSKPFGWPKSITVFLNSMAATLGSRAIAVILSGMDSDGSAALAAVKANGGRTFAQSDAPRPDMPASAVATGHVDFLVSAADISAKLRRIGHRD